MSKSISQPRVGAARADDDGARGRLQMVWFVVLAPNIMIRLIFVICGGQQFDSHPSNMLTGTVVNVEAT